MRYSVYFILLISIFSCNQKEKSTEIEIYFTKDRILCNEGIPLKDSRIYKNLRLDTIPFYANRKNEKFDTVVKDFLSLGKFNAKTTDLSVKPFIKDSEIEYLDIKKSELKLNDSGFQKFLKLDYKIDNKRQFVITVNKKPILTGYLMSSIASFYHIDNFITFDDSINLNDTIRYSNHPFKICCQKSHGKVELKLTNLNAYPNLINAFKETNRLK